MQYVRKGSDSTRELFLLELRAARPASSRRRRSPPSQAPQSIHTQILLTTAPANGSGSILARAEDQHVMYVIVEGHAVKPTTTRKQKQLTAQHTNIQRYRIIQHNKVNSFFSSQHGFGGPFLYLLQTITNYYYSVSICFLPPLWGPFRQVCVLRSASQYQTNPAHLSIGPCTAAAAAVRDR